MKKGNGKTGERHLRLDEHYTRIAESYILDFAEKNSLDAVKAKYRKDFGCFECMVKLNEVEVFFLLGDFLSYGYRFIEGEENGNFHSIITRFHFPFSDYFFSPYDIHNALDLQDFKTLDFHCITKEEMIGHALSVIFDFISVNRLRIENINRDAELQRKLTEGYEHDLKLTSKRVTKEKLSKNFVKYMRGHEVDLYYHNNNANDFMEFVLNGKSEKLKKHLQRRSQKGKLLLFEQRYFDYLSAHHFERPSEITFAINKEAEQSKKAYVIASMLIMLLSLVVIFVFNVVMSKLAERNLFNGYEVLNGYSVFNNLNVFFIIAVAALSTVLELIFAGVYRKFGAKSYYDTIGKGVKISIFAVCIALLIGYGVFEWNEAQTGVALGDSDVYYSASFDDKEHLPYHSERLQFVLIEGVSYEDDEGREVYDNTFDDMSLIIIRDNRYDDYMEADNSTCDLEKALDTLKQHGVSLQRLRDYQAFETTYHLDD